MNVLQRFLKDEGMPCFNGSKKLIVALIVEGYFDLAFVSLLGLILKIIFKHNSYPF
jgi:hypothetical protein